MMLPGPSQQAHSCCGALLRGVPLPDGRGYLAVCRQTSGKTTASKQFAEEVLKAHNDYRKKHGVPPLKLCKKLNRGAQLYAEELATTRVLKHSSESANGKCGENLAWASYDQSGHCFNMISRWNLSKSCLVLWSPSLLLEKSHFPTAYEAMTLLIQG
ncbi:Golgi-associated plant pathogenesis-related protein 1 isoform X2 [Aphelocoma coerulescens]|uniref:Golgi-associated plant pathogenesis-related protein 1 isoform X2 n=1 Tax=Aphelocoma coerulescens TaxID=39617 RepID=UPI003604FEFC